MARKKHDSLKKIIPKTRKSEILNQRKAFLIACEGECTEPNYINSLVRQEKLNKNIAEGTLVKIARHQHSDPLGVFKDLMAVPNKDDFDECWIVIDRDEIELAGKGVGGHSKDNFDNAIKECNKNKVKIACSNPCFELWIVLHFEYRDATCSRDDIQSKALQLFNSLRPHNKKLKKIDDLKSVQDIYSFLKNKTNIAIQNAKRLYENEEEYMNPSTGIHKLITSMIDGEEK